jgi:hypothetical protein
MYRTVSAVSSTTLFSAVVLIIAGCGPSGGGSSSAAASQQSTATTASTGATAATPAPGGNTSASGGGSDGGGSGASSASCSHGIQPGTNGVVDIECGGPATIRITAGSVSKSITGGTCRQADTTWTVTAGVITQYGVYTGPPVDVVTVAATVGKDASVQAELGGKMVLVDSAKFTLSAGGKSAHVAGTSDRNADIANAPVTVDVTC